MVSCELAALTLMNVVPKRRLFICGNSTYNLRYTLQRDTPRDIDEYKQIQ